MSTAAQDHLTITIDGRTTQVAPGTTILNAARQMGITIPTLCNFRGLPPYAACRVCLVESRRRAGRQSSPRAAIRPKRRSSSTPTPNKCGSCGEQCSN